MPNKRPQILIIDDQMESVALLLQYFRGQAIDVMTALDGAEGLRKAILGQPDVILLDVFMAQMNGYEVCCQLKRDTRTARIPVIFLSASDSLDSKLNGFAAGGVDYICKPFSSEEVLVRVFVHFKTSRQLASLEQEASHNTPEPSREVQLITDAVAHLQEPEPDWQGTEALARKLGVNEKKLNALFRSQFGMTVSEYQLNQRLEGARWKLANSFTQVQIIAREAGYNNASDFSRAFRLRYGIEPRKYRHASAGALLGASSVQPASRTPLLP